MTVIVGPIAEKTALTRRLNRKVFRCSVSVADIGAVGGYSDVWRHHHAVASSTVSRDSSKQILSELKKLRKELGGRLDEIETRLDSASIPAVKPGKDAITPASAGSSAASGAASLGRVTPSSERTGNASREVTVKIQPLADLAMVRVVESALLDTEGVQSASLRELRGDSAVIEARVSDGVPLISSLRRKLPIAFDVTDSDRGSFTIALTQPGSDRTGGATIEDAL